MAHHKRLTARFASKNGQRRRRGSRPGAFTAPLRFMRLALERLEERTLLATIVWDGEGSTNAWNNAANWFDETNGVNNVLPTLADDVEIRASFADETIALAGLTVTVNSLQSAAGINVASSTLNLLSDSQFDGPVALSGSIGGGGAVTITDTLTWTGGNLNDGGTVNIAPGATLTIDTTGSVFSIGSRIIENQGTIDWIRGGLNASDPLTINNRPGALFNVRDGNSFGSSGSGRILNNEGTLRKSAGAGTSIFQMILSNTGSVEVNSGTLALRRTGTSSGHFSIDAGATLEFRGEFNNPHVITLGPAGSIVGEGRLLIADQTVTIQGSGVVEVETLEISTTSSARLELNTDISVPNVLLATGALGGTGALMVTEAMTWSGAADMHDGGTTEIAAGATLTVNSAVSGMGLRAGRTLDNFGRIEWVAGNMATNAGVTIRNRPGGDVQHSIRSDRGNRRHSRHRQWDVPQCRGTGQIGRQRRGEHRHDL